VARTAEELVERRVTKEHPSAGEVAMTAQRGCRGCRGGADIERLLEPVSNPGAASRLLIIMAT